MKVFVARQPIFNLKGDEVCYELLFRSSNINSSNFLDGELATVDVLNNAFLAISGISTTMGKKAFVNFDQAGLLNELPLLFPPSMIAIEILESVEPTPEVLKVVRKYKELGYTLVLDDFVYDNKFDSLVELVDMAKIDFMRTFGGGRDARFLKNLNKDIKLLAEKIETAEDYNEAVKYGYTLFQGYFLGKPAIITAEDMLLDAQRKEALAREVENGDLNTAKIERLVRQDLNLMLKMLRLAKSDGKDGVSSLNNLLARTEADSLRRKIYVLTKVNRHREEHDLASVEAFARGMFCELIAKCTGEADPSTAFLVGSLSVLTSLDGDCRYGIIESLPLSGEVIEGITGDSNSYAKILAFVKVSMAHGGKLPSEIYREMGITEMEALECYRNAILSNLFRECQVS